MDNQVVRWNQNRVMDYNRLDAVQQAHFDQYVGRVGFRQALAIARGLYTNRDTIARLARGGYQGARAIINAARRSFSNGRPPKRSRMGGSNMPIVPLAGNPNKTTVYAPAKQGKGKRPRVKASEYSAPDTTLRNFFSVLTSSVNAQSANSIGFGENAATLSTLAKIHILSVATSEYAEFSQPSTMNPNMKYRFVKKLFIKNNYNFKARFHIWDSYCVAGGSSSTATIFAEGIAANSLIAAAAGTITSSTLGVMPKDAFGYLPLSWRLRNHQQVELAPGETVVFMHDTGIRNFNGTANDVAVEAGMHEFFIIMHGDLIHDSGQAEAGISEAKLDTWQKARITTWQEYAGDKKALRLSQSLNTITTQVQVDPSDPGTETTIGN